MARWECIVCGLIYDEREGWPEDGIAAGTRWADVPDDWTCPDCGVGKDDFELVPGSESDDLPQTSISEPTQANTIAAEPEIASEPAEVNVEISASKHVVIIGSGLAGYGLARELRRNNSEVPITLITADGGEVYSKPLLSTGYTKNFGYEQLALQSAADLATQLNLTILTRTRVKHIDSERKMLILERGGAVNYDSLVLATGADVIRPHLEGDGAEDVLSINDLDDYARFQTVTKERAVNKVIIIGAGLIGCEFTNDLTNGGFKTEAVDPMGWCLPTLLPEACGKALQHALESKGATFHFGKLAESIHREGDGYAVRLNDGCVLKGDIVLSAVGVRPNTALAASAGIDIGRGIKTDRYLRTSVADIYALGDCAEVDGHVLVYVAPLSAAARALGASLAGQATAVQYPAMPVAIKTPACPVTVAPPPKDAAGEWHIEGDAPNLKATFIGSAGELLGYALTGDATKEKAALTRALPPILF